MIMEKFLIRHDDIELIKRGERVMTLVEFSGVPPGTKGTVTAIEIKTVARWRPTSMCVQWDIELQPGEWNKKEDWFGENELKYLVFQEV